MNHNHDKNDEKKEAEKFIDHFIEFISDCSEMEDHELENELRAQGIDIDRLVADSQNFINSSLEKERLSWQENAKEKRKSNIEKFSKRESILAGLSKRELIAKITGFADAKGSDFAFAFRNLKIEDMTEDELRDIICEYEQLDDE